jgi:hypothetical protein
MGQNQRCRGVKVDAKISQIRNKMIQSEFVDLFRDVESTAIDRFSIEDDATAKNLRVSRSSRHTRHWRISTDFITDTAILLCHWLWDRSISVYIMPEIEWQSLWIWGFIELLSEFWNFLEGSSNFKPFTDWIRWSNIDFLIRVVPGFRFMCLVHQGIEFKQRFSSFF